MTLMSWVLFALSFITVGFTWYYLFRGRKLYRGIIFWNFIVSLQFLTVYLLVSIDFVVVDFFTWQEITGYLVKPLIVCFSLILMLNTYFLGKRNDN